MLGDDLVAWSVAEVNRENQGRNKSIGTPCPSCGKDDWRAYHGIDSQYKSMHNPGEYVRFTCINCGYAFEDQC